MFFFLSELILPIQVYLTLAPGQSENQSKQKRDKYLHLAWELKKLWNEKVTVIPVVNGVLGTIPKGLVKELKKLELGGREHVEALLRSAKILRRVPETWRDLLSFRLLGKTISWRWCEKLARNNNNNNSCGHQAMLVKFQTIITVSCLQISALQHQLVILVISAQFITTMKYTFFKKSSHKAKIHF